MRVMLQLFRLVRTNQLQMQRRRMSAQSSQPQQKPQTPQAA
jgi:hypothetical protein